MSLDGIKENLAFAFSDAEDFLVGSDKFGAEISVTAYLTLGDPVGKYGAPVYILRTVYFWSPKYPKQYYVSEPSEPESNPFYGTRFPYEWAPPGIFDNPYQLPFEIFPSESSRAISVTSPRSIFLKKCAEEIETPLQMFIDEEIDKWLKIGTFSNFIYFSSTFGLGDITPNSLRVRQLVTFQGFLGIVILVILIPTLLSRRDYNEK